MTPKKNRISPGGALEDGRVEFGSRRFSNSPTRSPSKKAFTLEVSELRVESSSAIDAIDSGETSFTSADLPLSLSGKMLEPLSPISELSAKAHDDQGLFIHGTAYILNTNHWIYNYWWRFIVILTYWNLLQVPFSVAFPEMSPVMDTLVWIVDSIFFLDILVVASTPIHVHGDQCNDRKIIAKRYLKLHFWIDLLASIPFNRIGMALAPNNPYMRLLALTRTLRVRKLVKLLEKMEKQISVSYTATVLVKLLSLVLILAHMEACLFWFIGDAQEPKENWTQPFQDLNDEWDQYLVSLYWAVTTYTTVGYGDISPVNKAEMIFAIIIMLINMSLTAYVLGNMTMLSTKVDESVQDYRANVSRVFAYLQRKRIPDELVLATLQQLETNQELAGETDDALHGVAPYIRNIILGCLYHDKLSSCLMLMNTSDEFINSLAHVSSMELFQPNTCILKCKERSANLYFVLSGKLVAQDSNGEILRNMRTGSAFGGESVFCDLPQYYSVWSKTLVKALVMDMSSVKTICAQFQADHRLVCSNILSYFQDTKPSNDIETQDLSETMNRIKSHINSLKTDMVTKLCYSASAGDILAVKALLQSDPDHDINTGDYDGRRPMHVAAASGNVDMLDYLLSSCGANANVIDNFEGTPLQDAVKRGHVAAAKRIISAGGELLLEDAGCTMCTLAMEGNVETVRLYLECGAHPDAADYDMRTGLHIACAEGNIPMVKLFVKMGGSLDFKDRFETTPLDEAEKSEKNTTVLSFLKTLLKEDSSKEIDPDKLQEFQQQRNPSSTNLVPSSGSLACLSEMTIDDDAEQPGGGASHNVFND